MLLSTIRIFLGDEEMKYLIIYCRVFLSVSGYILLGNVIT